MTSETCRQESAYPTVIVSLPEAKVQFKGARAWILQSDGRQLVFFEFEAGMDLPPHNHTYPQWGLVIDGEMELKVDGKPRVCSKGDEYLIPARAMHCAKFLKRTRVMDLFPETRYTPK